MHESSTTSGEEILIRRRIREADDGAQDEFDDVSVDLGWYDKHQISGPRIWMPRFGRIPAPATLAEFIGVADQIAARSDAGICGWRGQSCGAWGVQTGAARRALQPWSRRESRERLQMHERLRDLMNRGEQDRRREKVREEGAAGHQRDVEKYEQYLLNQARRRGFGFVDGRELSDLQLLALLQHHGAATNLLDVSRSVVIALWFAASVQPDETGVVIAFDQARLTTVNAEKAELPLAKLNDDLAREHARTPVGYWAPDALTPRILGQHGQFLLPLTGEEPWGTVPLRATYVWQSDLEANSLGPDDARVFFIAVTPDLKESVRVAGENGLLGLDEAEIYPDLPGFAQANQAGRAIPLSPYP